MRGTLILFLAVFLSNVVFSQNDDCINAIVVVPTLTNCNFQAGSSANATQSFPSCSGGGIADDDVWYSFTANSNDMTITVDPTVGYDAVIELYSGSCGTLTSIQCEDINGLNGDEVLVNATLTNGSTYFFRVFHYGIGSGTSTFSLCVAGLAPPTNNTACNAFALSTVTPSCNFDIYTNLGSTGSSVPTPSACGGSSPFQGGYAGGDVWFSVVVPPSGQLDIFTLGVDFSDGAMALYSGTCSSLTLVECDDDGDPGDGILMPHIYQTGLTPGATMFIRFWEFNNDANGQFGICVSSPDNDLCANAQQICDLNGYGGITSSSYNADFPSNMTGTGQNGIANSDPAAPFGQTYTGTSPVQIDNNSWLKFTASATTATLFVQVNYCSNGNGMQMQIFSGTNCTNFIAVSNFLETTNSQTITATGLIPGNDYYIMVDGFAGDICSYTISATSGVQVVEAISSKSAICIGDTASISALVIGTGSYTYNWSSAPIGFSSTSATNTISPVVNTLYAVDITGLCGAVTTASVYVTAHTPPTALVTALPDTVCAGQSINLNGNPTNGTSPFSHNWTGAGQPFLNTITSSTPSFTSLIAGDYMLNYEVIDTIGCSAQDSILITVNPLPVVNVTGTTSICVGDSIIINATGGGNYTWSNGGILDSISVTPNSTTNYTVIVSDANSCVDSASINITVNSLPIINITGNTSICDGDSTTLTASGANNYIWNTVATSTSITISPIINTNYTVVGIDANGCQDSTQIMVNILPQPVAAIVGNNTICFGESIVLTATGGGNYVWNTSDTTAAINANPADTATFTVVVNAGGCIDSASYIVDVIPLPIINAYNDTTIILGQSATIIAQGDGSFSWSPSEGLSCVTCPAPTAQPTETTTYCVESTQNNCINTSCVTVYVDNICGELYVPNAFSPNGDGSNDCLKVHNNCLSEVLFRVYSRWGELIYETEDIDGCWDGTDNGKELNTGVYTFTVAAKLINGEEAELKGNVTLFK